MYNKCKDNTSIDSVIHNLYVQIMACKMLNYVVTRKIILHKQIVKDTCLHKSQLSWLLKGKQLVLTNSEWESLITDLSVYCIGVDLSLW